MLNKIISLAALATLAVNTANANDFTVSGKWGVANNFVARNLGIALSETGVHFTLNGKIQHESGFLFEVTLNNGNDSWSSINEFALGWSEEVTENWLLRTDLFRIEFSVRARSHLPFTRLRRLSSCVFACSIRA